MFLVIINWEVFIFTFFSKKTEFCKLFSLIKFIEEQRALQLLCIYQMFPSSPSELLKRLSLTLILLPPKKHSNPGRPWVNVSLCQLEAARTSIFRRAFSVSQRHPFLGTVLLKLTCAPRRWPQEKSI